MATITDVLETVFTPPDLGPLVAGLLQSAQGFVALAASEGVATAATTTLATAVGGLNAEMAVIGGVFAAAAVAIGFTAKGLQQFGQDEQDVFQAAVVLRNLGLSPMIDELQRFASELQKTTSVDDEAVVKIGGLLAQFGVASRQIEPAIQAIVDASKAGRGSLEDIARAFGLAAQSGQSRRLRLIVGDLKLVGDEAHRTQQIIEALNRNFAGGAAAQRNTLQGTIEALQEAAANFFSAIGRIAAPAFITFLNQVTFVFNLLTDQLTKFAAFLERIGVLAPLNPAAGVGTPGAGGLQGSQMLEELRGINANTKTAAEGIIRQAFGGPGTIGRSAGNIRALRAAIRGAF